MRARAWRRAASAFLFLAAARACSFALVACAAPPAAAPAAPPAPAGQSPFPLAHDRALLSWFLGGGGGLSGAVYSVVEEAPALRRLFAKRALAAGARVARVPRGMALSAGWALAAARGGGGGGGGGAAGARARFVAAAHAASPRWGVAAALVVATEEAREARGRGEVHEHGPYVDALSRQARAEPPALARHSRALLGPLRSTAAGAEVAALYEDSRDFAAMAAMAAVEGALPAAYLESHHAASAAYFAARRGAIDVCCDNQEPGFADGVFWALVPLVDLAGPGRPAGAGGGGKGFAVLDAASGDIVVHAAAHMVGEELEFGRANASDAEVLGIWGTAWERPLPDSAIPLTVGTDGTEDDDDEVDVARRALLANCGAKAEMAIVAERPSDTLLCAFRAPKMPAEEAIRVATQGGSANDAWQLLDAEAQRAMDAGVYMSVGVFLERRLAAMPGGSDEDDVKLIKKAERKLEAELADEARTPDPSVVAEAQASIAAYRVRVHEKQALVGALNHCHYRGRELSTPSSPTAKDPEL